MIYKIFTEMLAFGEATKNRKLTAPELTKIFRRFIKDDNIVVKTCRSDKVDKNQVVIGGLYDPYEDEMRCKSIFLYVNYNPKQTSIYIKNLDWADVCMNLLECMGHEIIHQNQFRVREFDIGPHIFVSAKEDREIQEEQEYLGNPDEIEAYGYSIAAEVFLKHHPKSITGKLVVKTVMYRQYVALFGASHPIIKQLLEHTIRYFTKLQRGEMYYVKEPERCT